MNLEERINLCKLNFGALKHLFLNTAERKSYRDQQKDLNKIFEAIKISFEELDLKKQKEILQTVKCYKDRENLSLLLTLKNFLKEENVSDPKVVSFDTVVKTISNDKPIEGKQGELEEKLCSATA